jgi:hypothetical protein
LDYTHRRQASGPRWHRDKPKQQTTSSTPPQETTETTTESPTKPTESPVRPAPLDLPPLDWLSLDDNNGRKVAWGDEEVSVIQVGAKASKWAD